MLGLSSAFLRLCVHTQDTTIQSASLRSLDMSLCTELRSLEVLCDKLTALRLCSVPCLREVSLTVPAAETLDLSMLVAMEALEIVAPNLKVVNAAFVLCTCETLSC